MGRIQGGFQLWKGNKCMNSHIVGGLWYLTHLQNTFLLWWYFCFDSRKLRDKKCMMVIITAAFTHWGRVTHICVGNLTTTGSDNGLSPGRRQANTWTNAGILLIGPLGTNFSEMLFWIQTFSFMEMHFKMSSAKWRPFCLGLNVLNIPCESGNPGGNETGSWHGIGFQQDLKSERERASLTAPNTVITVRAFSLTNFLS